MAPRIRIERDEAIVTPIRNRPDAPSAIEGAKLDALNGALAVLEAGASSRTVLLTGAGRAVSAGTNIEDYGTTAPRGSGTASEHDLRRRPPRCQER